MSLILKQDVNSDSKESIFEKCLCRRKQIELLLKLVEDDEEYCSNSIFIFGNTGSGKTHVVTTLFSTLSLQYSYVNCIEHFNAKLIYQKILVDFGCAKTCSTMVDFCRLLKECSVASGHKRLHLIFEKAERLRNMDSNLLPALLRLTELTKLNICIVFLSEIIFEKFLTSTGLYDPVKIHFPDYLKSELLTILKLDCPKEHTKEFYGQYCQTLIDVFSMVCRNLNELRHLAVLNFTQYCEPIVNGDIERNDVRKLWQAIAPHMRKALQTIYLREVSSVQWETMQKSLAQNDKPPAQVELPYYSKYMLLAAYVASYNPAYTDRRFFVKKTAGKMSKRLKVMVKTAKKIDKQFLGPKPFPIDRLMAIFYSIVEGGVSSSANILSQLSTLVTLNLLVKTSADDLIDTPKYKCIVPLEFAVSVGKQVDFDVMQYLHDT